MGDKENLILLDRFFDAPLYLLSKDDLSQNQPEGQNQKNILVVIHQSDQKDNLFEFLAKILTSIDLNIKDDICLLKLTSDDSISFGKWTKEWNVSKIISFGITPFQLGLQFEDLKYASIFCNDTHFLFADRLNTLFSDKSLKAALWECLQQLKND